VSETGEVGRRAEDLAANHLRSISMRILHRNLRFGRLGEIDIVAEHDGYVVIVEVKAKLTGGIGGLEHITAAKIRKLCTLAEAYLQRFPGEHRGLRFDAVEVQFADSSLQGATIRHIADAFRP
jgi:putative endonuclease